MTVLREIRVVSGHVAIAMSGISAFSSMFIGGRPENSKIEFCETARKGGRTVTPLIQTKFGGGGGYGARRAVGVDTSTLAATAGVEVVSFLTSSAACSPTRTTWPEAPQK